MKNIISKIFNKPTPDFIVTYRWLDDESTIETITTTSAAIASLEADPCIEVLKVEKA